MKRILILILLTILFAPMPWGIAINSTSGQCAAFWGGDEYYQYDLPEGWQAYYPSGSSIETPYGTCQWDVYNWEGRAQKCCQELGLAYLDEDLGRGRPTPFTLMTWGVITCGGLLVLGILLLLAFGLFLLGKAIFRRSSRPT